MRYVSYVCLRKHVESERKLFYCSRFLLLQPLPFYFQLLPFSTFNFWLQNLTYVTNRVWSSSRCLEISYQKQQKWSDTFIDTFKDNWNDKFILIYWFKYHLLPVQTTKWHEYQKIRIPIFLGIPIVIRYSVNIWQTITKYLHCLMNVLKHELCVPPSKIQIAYTFQLLPFKKCLSWTFCTSYGPPKAVMWILIIAIFTKGLFLHLK